MYSPGLISVFRYQPGAPCGTSRTRTPGPHVPLPLGGERDFFRGTSEAGGVHVASLNVGNLLAVLGDAQGLLAASARHAFGVLAVVADSPHVALREKNDGAVGVDGDVGLRRLGGEAPDAPRNVVEIDLDGDLGPGLFEFEVGVGGANRLGFEWQDVEAGPFPVTLEVEVFAIGRPRRLGMLRVEAGHVVRFAAVRADDVNVPRPALTAGGIGNPFHVGRPGVIAASVAAELGAGDLDDAVGFASFNGQHVEAALAAGHPDGQALAVGGDGDARNVLVAVPEQPGLAGLDLQLVQARGELAIAGEVELRAVRGPREVRVVAFPIRQTPGELGAAAGHSLGFFGGDGPDFPAQSEREG